jgi:hypothetical protein
MIELFEWQNIGVIVAGFVLVVKEMLGHLRHANDRFVIAEHTKTINKLVTEIKILVSVIKLKGGD